MDQSIISAYRANLAAHPGMGAQSALKWAKDEAARVAFFATLENDHFGGWQSHKARDLEIDSDEWLSGTERKDMGLYWSPDQRVAFITWREDDDEMRPDHFGDVPVSTREHYSSLEFFSGRSDYISAKESRDFGRDDRSYDLRSEYADLIEYYRERHSKQVADVKARADIFARLTEMDSPPVVQYYGHGYVTLYRDAANVWRECDNQDASCGVWGVDHDDMEKQAWEIGIARAYEDARALADAHAAARRFAGV